MATETEDENLDTTVADAGNDTVEGAEGGEAEASSPEAVRLASMMGWKDPAKWEGSPPPGGLLSAEQFLSQVPEVMRNTRKKADRTEGTLSRVIAQLAKLEKRSSSADAQAARTAAKEAFEAGDFDAAADILSKAGAQPASDKPEALQAFEQRNADWYGIDDDATAYAAALDAQYAKASGGVTDPDAHMRKVEAGVKKRFPELFADGKGKDDENADRRPKPPLVQRGRGVDRSRSGAAMTVADMSPQQRKAAQDMQVSHADWVKSYNQMNRQDA